MRPQPRMGKHSWRDPKARAAEMQRQCDSWNAMHPVGTSVLLTRDNGITEATHTTSEAYVCESGYPVIFMKGVRGYYLLARVEPQSDRASKP